MAPSTRTIHELLRLALRGRVEAILKEMGLTPEQAIRRFVKQEQGRPEAEERAAARGGDEPGPERPEARGNGG